MLILASVLAAAGAACMAGAAHLQHGAVHRSAAGPVLRLSALRTILRTPEWYAGNGLVVLGAGLHIIALTLAPITVVQPIGMLALVLTVAFSGTAPTRAVAVALAMSMVGVVGMTALSATGTGTAVPAPDIGAAQWTLLAAAAAALAARFATGTGRALLLAVAAAVLFGFTSALVRAAAVAPIAPELLAAVLAEAAVA
ncbi:MAG: glycosyltransferase family 4 protein, partial [Glycomyces artemisiae]|nr:glycosyltransferase family 4 protein [Glycomyces artemisiae]